MVTSSNNIQCSECTTKVHSDLVKEICLFTKGPFRVEKKGDGVSAEGSLVAFVILIIFCVGIL